MKGSHNLAMDHYNPYVTDPPFEDTYKDLFLKQYYSSSASTNCTTYGAPTTIEQHDLPLVDLAHLAEASDKEDKERCRREIVQASKEWGFFQVVNHGISHEMLQEMAKEQVKVFREPFQKKKTDNCLNMKLSQGSYRWGTPSATCLRQLSWSEAFHIPLTDIIHNNYRHHASNFSSTVKHFATTISELAQKLANILAEKVGHEFDHQTMSFLGENRLPNTCYLRMNRYPPCPKYSQVFGMMPHTDSDFLTILYQDQVGGLQSVKDGKWIAVKPNPEALIVNIGDLFQAWSNGVYKSVEHRVVANPKVERFSTAYFLCPSSEAVIESWSNEEKPSMYKKFSFEEYRQQVQDDVRSLGYKIGLSRFLA